MSLDPSSLTLFAIISAAVIGFIVDVARGFKHNPKESIQSKRIKLPTLR